MRSFFVPFIENTHEFDGHLLVIKKVGTLENDTKGTLSDLLSNAVVDTHYVRRRRGHGCGVEVVVIKDTKLGITGLISGRQTRDGTL